MDMRSNQARIELENLAQINDWKEFHQWLVLDWQGPEGSKWKEEIVSRLIYVAEQNSKGAKMRLEIVHDPRRARRRYLLDLFTAWSRRREVEIARKAYLESHGQAGASI